MNTDLIIPRWYQEDAISSIYHYFLNGGKGNPLIALPTACHAKGTKILMYSGTLKNIEDVKVNDLIMGPDSKPRKVLELFRGQESMVKIKPIKGEEFIVNVGHILSLKTTQEKGLDKKYYKSHLQKGTIENIEVWNYINSSKWYKHTRKLWRTGIEFSTEYSLPLTPYFLGIFLGDGSYSHEAVTITSMDEEILSYFKLEADWNFCSVRRSNNGSKADTLWIKHDKKKNHKTPIHQILIMLGLNQKTSEFKFIPQVYKTASRKDRLELLAGLIDTNGSWGKSGYDYISKSEKLLDDIVFLARSLGFSASKLQCRKSDQHGTWGTYYRTYIGGNGLEEIPVKLKRKKANKPIQRKDALVTGFSYEILPVDDYYGFELDQDYLYLTGDFIVHHNSGKSIIPALFIERVLKRWSDQRFLLVTHVSVLITQNAEKLIKVWANAPIGIHSAGLKQRDVVAPIIFGGIQSMIKVAEAFGHRDIIFIDECHLVNQDENSLYLKFIAIMKKINPNVKIVGLTATKFRMGQGLLTEDGLFTDIIYDLTDMEGFNKLLNEGYLSPLIPRPTNIKLDTSNVDIQKGEFVQKQLQYEVDKAEITWKALQETVYFGQNRKSWLIFASGIEHSNHIAEMLCKLGVECASVHSKQPTKYNDAALKAHKNLELRAIASYSKLTTGLDHPAVDLIDDLRPTMSVVLHIQKYGRGMRIYPGKLNCLVLDHANNIPRLGCVNDPVIPNKKGNKIGDLPVKICDACGVYNHISARKCDACGAPFEFQVKITKTAGTEELIRNPEALQIEYFDVTHAVYKKHQKLDKPEYLTATYFCGMNTFREFQFPQSKNRSFFANWWRQRSAKEVPATASDALVFTNELRRPKRIRVHVNRMIKGRNLPEILGVEF